MHTYVDFLTHIKGVEYILSVLTITGFVLFVESLKEKPFRTLIRATREDADHLRKQGRGTALRTAGRMLSAPFLGLLYVVALPFVFAYALGTELLRMAAVGLERVPGLAGRTAFFGWRPMEAYLGGRKEPKGKGAPGKDAGTEEGGKET